MRLRTATLGAVICAAAIAVAVTSASASLPADRSEGVYVARCSKEDRTAAFVGVMRQVKDSQRMWMRFTLLERALPATTYQPLSIPGLESWHKSRPGVRRFSFRQRVRALAEAAFYRVEVEYRWYDADGNLLRQAFKRSRRCRQPGALPNLQVHRIGRRPSGQYYVRVRNVGRDVAAGAQVQLFVDGLEAGLISLPDLLPAAVRGMLFSGPPCEGSVQAVADPTSSVRESAEDDNALTIPFEELE
jgi:CARDB